MIIKLLRISNDFIFSTFFDIFQHITDYLFCVYIILKYIYTCFFYISNCHFRYSLSVQVYAILLKLEGANLEFGIWNLEGVRRGPGEVCMWVGRPDGTGRLGLPYRFPSVSLPTWLGFDQGAFDQDLTKT